MNSLVSGRWMVVLAVVVSACAESPTRQSPPILVSVAVSPSTAELHAVQDSIRLTATAQDQNGRPLQGQTFQWTSSDTTRATVDSGGIVRALAAGNVTIMATTEGKSGSANLALTLRQTVTVQTAGGEVRVRGAGGVVVPKGAFASPQPVTVEVTRAPEVEVDYSVTGEQYRAGPRVAHELRVRIGTTAPLESITLELEVPIAFTAALAATHRPELFVEMLQNEGEEILDDFVPVAATYDAATRRFHSALPPEAFTHWRRMDDTLEAIVLVGSVPVAPQLQTLLGQNPAAIANGWARRVGSTDVTPCPYNVLSAPLDKVQVSSKYDGSKHKGLDLRAQTPLPVYASRRGVVEKIGFDERPLPKPDPRSGKMIKGWGLYVKLLHGDGSRTIYGHLTKGSTGNLAMGHSVAAGEQIALSGNTGGSQSSHLHVEYRTPGSKPNGDNPFDPSPCLATGIEIDPASSKLEIGQAAPFTVRVITVAGSKLSAQAEAKWNSITPQVATVDASGVVRAIAVGTTQIEAALGRMQATAAVTVSLPLPRFYTQISAFQSAVNVMGTLTFDGIQNGVVSPIPHNQGVTFYSEARYGTITVTSPWGNSNVPGFMTISGWASNKTVYNYFNSEAPFGDALIPGLSGTYGQGVLFSLPNGTVTAAGAHFGSIHGVTECCVSQSVVVTFWDGGSLNVSLNEIRGGERPANAFFGISSPGRPIKTIAFDQVGHRPLLDNFTYGQAR